MLLGIELSVLGLELAGAELFVIQLVVASPIVYRTLDEPIPVDVLIPPRG